MMWKLKLMMLLRTARSSYGLRGDSVLGCAVSNSMLKGDYERLKMRGKSQSGTAQLIDISWADPDEPVSAHRRLHRERGLWDLPH